MRIVSLKKLVEEENINIVSIPVGEGVSPMLLDVGEPEFIEYETYLVKGDFKIDEDPMSMQRILKVERLEKELGISLNGVDVTAEQNEPEEVIEEAVNLPVTAIVFNRHSLASANRDINSQHVTAFAHSVLEAYQMTRGDATLEDFAVVEIDWNNRTVALKSIHDGK